MGGSQGCKEGALIKERVGCEKRVNSTRGKLVVSSLCVPATTRS